MHRSLRGLSKEAVDGALLRIAGGDQFGMHGYFINYWLACIGNQQLAADGKASKADNGTFGNEGYR